ncbi:hypothetical protein AAHN97_22740 [Chitinophaga niabensis]|uniref:hypothetical protein n=1 Tax=Chitinophaga niabensis TaxID=536979 RepID=UPI0031BA540A
MNTRHSFAIISILVFITLFLVYLKNAASLPNTQNNGFSRKWLDKAIALDATEEINTSFQRISGISNSKFFLSTLKPDVITTFSLDLKAQDTIFLNLPKINGSYTPNILNVDSTDIRIYLPNLALSLYSSFTENKFDSSKFQSDIYTRFSQLSDSQIIVRALSENQTRQKFKKVNTRTGEVLKESKIIEDDDSFMGFDSDGTLNYDSKNKLLLYVQYYRNEVYCFDSNLNVVYKSKTIDTIKYNHTNYTKLNKAGSEKITTSESRLIVNRNCIVDSENGLFYVLSNLKADNESPPLYNNNNTIDIYKTINGKYVGSFHLPREGKSRILSAVVTPPYLVALSKGNLSKYKIDYTDLK